MDDTPVSTAPARNFIPDCLKALDRGESLDTCPDLEGTDPIFNYMNYLDNGQCFAEAGYFTCQQIERMYWQWNLHRDPISSNACSEDEMLVEIQLVLDPDTAASENRFYLHDGVETIWSSFVDHLVFGLNEESNDSVIDLCLNASKPHYFVFSDFGGDGFAGDDPGTVVRVFRDGELLATIDGEFVGDQIVTIPADETPVPSSAPSTEPSGFPSLRPSDTPSFIPTAIPSVSPSDSPSGDPSNVPFGEPSAPTDLTVPSMGSRDTPSPPVTSGAHLPLRFGRLMMFVWSVNILYRTLVA